MSSYPEQPFSDFEERYFLAEILKKSSLPTTTLVNLIRDSGVDPAWNEIALPNGRSVSSCQQAYSALLVRTQPQQVMPPQTQDPTSKRFKRPYSMGDATVTSPLARELQPRPPAFQTVNGLPQPMPGPITMSPIEPPRKKRGRPTKSEFERRQAEARERGEVWPKPRNKAKAQRPSAEGAEAGTAASNVSSSVAAEEPAGEGTGGSVTTAGLGEGAPTASAAPTAVMNAPSTPSSVPPSSPALQSRGSQLEGRLQPAGQAQHGEKLSTAPDPTVREPRPNFFPPPGQGLLAELRPPQDPLLRGPSLQPRASPSQFSTYGPSLPQQFSGYQTEERPPTQRQQQP